MYVPKTFTRIHPSDVGVYETVRSSRQYIRGLMLDDNDFELANGTGSWPEGIGTYGEYRPLSIVNGALSLPLSEIILVKQSLNTGFRDIKCVARDERRDNLVEFDLNTLYVSDANIFYYENFKARDKRGAFTPSTMSSLGVLSYTLDRIKVDFPVESARQLLRNLSMEALIMDRPSKEASFTVQNHVIFYDDFFRFWLAALPVEFLLEGFRNGFGSNKFYYSFPVLVYDDAVVLDLYASMFDIIRYAGRKLSKFWNKFMKRPETMFEYSFPYPRAGDWNNDIFLHVDEVLPTAATLVSTGVI